MELPGMAADQLLIDENNIRDEHWEPPVRNLDRFFTSMYQYYVAKGLPAVILQQVCGVVTLGFTISASIFLIAFVDWSNLTLCKDELTCDTGSLIKQPFANSSAAFAFIVVIYGLLFGAFWIWKVLSAIHVILSAVTMERFYREKLGLRLSDLNEMQWHEVLQRLILLHEHGIHRVAIQDKLTEHDVVLRIMRKDNYMIGLINKKLLDLRVPWWISPIMSERLFLTKSLEWSLSFCILEYMFNEEFVISSSFLKNVPLLQTRLRVVGIVHMLLLPFMVIFMSIHFFLQNAQSFHSSKSYLGPRQWSPLALWSFREFNELPHIFNERINRSYEPSNEYIQSFSNPYTSLVASFVVYLVGACIATILLLSLFGEGVLLYVAVYDHNLLWYLGIFSGIYAGARSLIPDKTKKTEAPSDLVGNISACTHYYPPHWMNRCHTTLVKDEMSELFPFKVHLFGMELLSVLLTPIVLCFSLPPSAQNIIEFVRDHSKYVEGVGAVCDFSLFDFGLMGDDQYGAPVNGCMEESQRPDNGKMEKSFVNFQQAHPNWRAGSEGGEALLDKVRHYRAAMEHQRDHKIVSMLQDSVSYFLGGSNSNEPQYSKDDLSLNEIKSNTRISSKSSLQELGLSDSGDAVLNKTGEIATETLPKESQKDGITESSIPPNGMPPPISEKIPFSGPGGVWGPNGYTPKPPREYENESKNQSNVNPLEIGNHTARKSMPINSIFPPTDVAVSYYKSGAPSFSNKGMFQNGGVNTRPGLGSGPGLGPGGYGERSVSFSPDRDRERDRDRVRSRNDMPSILRSILKQENIDYQNDFYWMNRFQQEKMNDPVNFEKSLSQSTSILRKNNSAFTESRQGDSLIFDTDGSYFHSHSPSRSRANYSRINKTDSPYYSKARTRTDISRTDRGNEHSHSGFCFSLPEGLGGMDNSLGPGFESSILGGDMMTRDGDGEGDGDGGYSQMGRSYDIRGGGLSGRNQYTSLPQQPQQRLSPKKDTRNSTSQILM